MILQNSLTSNTSARYCEVSVNALINLHNSTYLGYDIIKMTLCLYSLPPQNPSIHVNSRQELLTTYPISIPGNHQGHQKQGESGKLLQPKEEFGGKTTKYKAISWAESLAEKHRKLPACLETKEASGVGHWIIVGGQSTFLGSFFERFPEGLLNPLKCIRTLIR